MDDKHLKQLLTTRAEQSIPESLDLRPDILRKIKVKPLSRTPYRRIAASVAFLLTLFTAIYALAQGPLHPDPGIQAVQAENLVVQINQTHALKTIDPIISMNVTLESAYADSNRIAVNYHVVGQAKSGTDVMLFSNPTLTDSQGRQYRWLPSTEQFANVPGTPDADKNVESFSHYGVMSFDSSILENPPASLSLKLMVEVAYSSMADRNRMVFIGQTAYDLTLPVNPGRVVAVNQSATATNTQIMLKKLVISPSLTRLDLCSTPQLFNDENWLDWKGVVTVEVDGKKLIDAQQMGIDGHKEDPCRALTIPNALMRDTGTWNVVISEFRNQESGVNVAGPWVFKFDVK